MQSKFHDSLGRVRGVAVIDVLGTMLVAYIVSKYYNVSILLTTVLMFSIGQLTHKALCIKTSFA